MNEPTPARPSVAKSPAPPSRRGLWIALSAGIGLLALGVWLVFAKLPSFLTRSTEPSASTSGPTKAGEARKIQATLFYVSDDGAELVPVNRDVLYGATAVEQAKHIVEAQVAAAPANLASAIPAATKVRAVFLAPHGEAYVDLSADVTTGHSGGSLNEALAVFAVVNALTSNLSGVTSVQILVEGKEVDTLAGHIDLRQPIGRALKWVRKAQ